MEIFKDIQGYPGCQISNQGRVWNSKTSRYLKPSLKDNGYYQINLIAINGKRKKEYIHRLIALAFIPNPNGYPEVNHIDRDRGNNVVENLEWCNRSMNQRHRGEFNRMIKVFDTEHNLVAEYPTIAECVETLNIPLQSIYSHLQGKVKKPYKGKYYFN